MVRNIELKGIVVVKLFNIGRWLCMKQLVPFPLVTGGEYVSLLDIVSVFIGIKDSLFWIDWKSWRTRYSLHHGVVS